MSYKCEVEYKCIKDGLPRGHARLYLNDLVSQSESIVMQKLRDKHRGYEIHLVKIDWK